MNPAQLDAAQEAVAREEEGVDLLPGDRALIDAYERHCQDADLARILADEAADRAAARGQAHRDIVEIVDQLGALNPATKAAVDALVAAIAAAHGDTVAHNATEEPAP